MVASTIPHTSGIYKITCAVNGKIYVGSSVHIYARWQSHKARLRNGNHRNRYLQRAWNKYGECSFTFEVIELVMPWSVLDREQYWLNKLKPYGKHGFNISRHADSPTRTKEVRERISQSHVGIRPNEETRAKMSMAKIGKKLSAETKAKMSISRLGNKNGVGHKGPLGVVRSVETKEKISKSKRLKFYATSADGTEVFVENLRSFCVENGLNPGRMIQVARGNENHHKGWKCRYA